VKVTLYDYIRLLNYFHISTCQWSAADLSTNTLWNNTDSTSHSRRVSSRVASRESTALICHVAWTMYYNLAVAKINTFLAWCLHLMVAHNVVYLISHYWHMVICSITSYNEWFTYCLQVWMKNFSRLLKNAYYGSELSFICSLYPFIWHCILAEFFSCCFAEIKVLLLQVF